MQLSPSEKSEAERIKQKFGKGSENIRIFELWDESVQSFFLTHTKIEEHEYPILGLYQPDHWFLLTTRRVLWSNPDEQPKELRHESVQGVGWSSGPDGWPGRDMSDPPDELVFNEIGKGHCKHYSPWLFLIDFACNRHEVFLEAGKNLIALRQYSGNSPEDGPKPVMWTIK